MSSGHFLHYTRKSINTSPYHHRNLFIIIAKLQLLPQENLSLQNPYCTITPVIPMISSVLMVNKSLEHNLASRTMLTVSMLVKYPTGPSINVFNKYLHCMNNSACNQWNHVYNVYTGHMDDGVQII